MNDTSGHVLHFTAPLHRESYDHDLVVFRQQAHISIMAMRDDAIVHPAMRTDILGTLDMARQVFDDDMREIQRRDQKRTLIILSDFLEDDGTYRFASDAVMGARPSAEALAEQLRRERHLNWTGVEIHLSTLQSTDLPRLANARRQAIWDFWDHYLGQRGGIRPLSDRSIGLYPE